MTPRRFYVSMYGAIWSLPRDGFEAALRDGTKGGIDLDEPRYKARQLRQEALPPLEDSRDERLPSRLRGEVVIFPLDWSADRFAEALAMLEREAWDEFAWLGK